MQQPRLGMKVAELRQLKTMTQEELAERCDVSARTIQRIEAGEVDPRAFTVRCLGEALDFDFEGQPTGGENLWLAVLHLSSCLCLVVVPLLLWSAKKAASARIDNQGRQVLNFQITMALVLLTGGAVVLGLPLALVLLGVFGASGAENGPLVAAAMVVAPLPMIAVGLFCTYQGVVNAVRAVADRPVHYPLSITFVK